MLKGDSSFHGCATFPSLILSKRKWGRNYRMLEEDYNFHGCAIFSSPKFRTLEFGGGWVGATSRTHFSPYFTLGLSFPPPGRNHPDFPGVHFLNERTLLISKISKPVGSLFAFQEEALDHVSDVNQLADQGDQPREDTPPGMAPVV